MSKQITCTPDRAGRSPSRPTWRQRLGILGHAASRPGYGKTCSADIDDAGDWRYCAIGERLGFPRIDNDLLEEIILQTDDGLYGSGIGFADSVSKGEIGEAWEYHGDINSENFDDSVNEIRAKADLMDRVRGDRMPLEVASRLVQEFDDVEVFADTACIRCGMVSRNVDVGVPDPETEDLGACEACGGARRAWNFSVLAYERTYRLGG